MRNKINNFSISLIVFLVISFSNARSFAQESKAEIKAKEYITWVYSGKVKTKGFLLDTQDSYLTISDLTLGKNNQTIRFEGADLDMLKFRRKGNVGRGLIYGGIGGALVGIVIGLASGDDNPNEFISFTAEDKALFLGAFFAIPGTILGGIIGSKKIKIPLKNKAQNLARQRALIEKYKRYSPER